MSHEKYDKRNCPCCGKPRSWEVQDSKIKVKIIVIGLEEQLQIDTLKARMVETRIEQMEAEFEQNGVPTTVWIR